MIKPIVDIINNIDMEIFIRLVDDYPACKYLHVYNTDGVSLALDDIENHIANKVELLNDETEH